MKHRWENLGEGHHIWQAGIQIFMRLCIVYRCTRCGYLTSRAKKNKGGLPSCPGRQVNWDERKVQHAEV